MDIVLFFMEVYWR